MKNVNWKDIAELVGIAAIVASLIFVGLALRQSQRESRMESGQTRASWFFANRDAINDYADVWVKGYAGETLTESESVIFNNLIRNIHTNNRFSWSREKMLGSAEDYPAHELAWILSKSPSAIKAWEAYQSDVEEMRRILLPGGQTSESGFGDIVRSDLEKLKHLNE